MRISISDLVEAVNQLPTPHRPGDRMTIQLWPKINYYSEPLGATTTNIELVTLVVVAHLEIVDGRKVWSWELEMGD